MTTRLDTPTTQWTDIPLDVVTSSVLVCLTLHDVLGFLANTTHTSQIIYNNERFWTQFFRAVPIQIQSTLTLALRHRQQRFIGTCLRLPLTTFNQRSEVLQTLLAGRDLMSLGTDLQLALITMPAHDFINKREAMQSLLLYGMTHLRTPWLQQVLITSPAHESDNEASTYNTLV